MADSPEGEGSFAHEYELSIRAAELTLLGVVRRNLVTAANADEYAYASCKDEGSADSCRSSSSDAQSQSGASTESQLAAHLQLVVACLKITGQAKAIKDS